MEDKLLLSVIIPVYNLERYIIPCIESVIANKGVDKDSFEVIIVNDGSTDDTQFLVEQYIEQHLDFQICLINQKNQGVSAARNAGLAGAKGKFVWFVDGDDAISCDAISTLQRLKDEDIDVIRIGDCVGKILFDDNSVLKNYLAPIDIQKGYFLTAYKLLGDEYAHGHTTYVWRRTFLLENNLNYPVSINHNEDYCLLVHALLLARDAYVNLSFQFYLYRSRENSESRGIYDFQKLDKYTRDRLEVLEKLLRIEVHDNEKKVCLQCYIANYVYSILWITCVYKKAPLFLIIYCFGRLKQLGQYPLKLSLLKVSVLRKWISNHSWIFTCFCIVYRVLKK